MSRKDPIIEEIYAVREKIAREAGYDIEDSGGGPSTAGGQRTEGCTVVPKKAEPKSTAS